MAYLNQIANYYDSLVLDSYAYNISGLIDRIKDAHKAIKSKAIEMGLKIPKEAKLTNNASGTSDLDLADTHHILDTAAAINNIPINRDGDQTINADSSYTVPVGYNAAPYKITIETKGSATAADILDGRTAWADGGFLTGVMLDKSGNLTASDFDYYTSNGKNYLYLTIPETGRYEKDALLQSNILYNTTREVEIPVTIVHDEKGELILDASIQEFPAGYYTSLNVKAVHKTGDAETNKIINIDNTVGELTELTGNLHIADGYDYFAPNALYSIQNGTIKAVTAVADKDTGEIKYYGGDVQQAGWVSSNVTKPVHYTPPTAEFTKNPTTGKVSVSTAGWITAGTEIGGLNAGSVTLSGVTFAGNSATTINGVSIGANSYYVKVDVENGYVTSDNSTALDLKVARFYNGTYTGTVTDYTPITTQNWYVNVSEGYNKDTSEKIFLVLSGSIDVSVTIDSNYEGTLQVIKSGWIDKKGITLDIPAKDQSYTLTELDLAETDHKFLVKAASGTLMKSLTINTATIYERLAAI